MASKLIAALMDNEQPIEELHSTWRSGYRTDTDQGTVEILQLALDMTGFCHELQLEEVQNTANMREFVRTKFCKSSYQETGVFGKGAVLDRIAHLLEVMVARGYRELLQDNIWLNYFVRLLIAFCESDEDECKMVGGYLSTLVLVNLAYVQNQLHNRRDRSPLTDNDDDEESSPTDSQHQHQRYVQKVFRMMLRNVEGSCGYSVTLPIISELVCRMLETYPKQCIVESDTLDVLAVFLQHRHGKMFQRVATCLRNLLTAEPVDDEIVDIVGNYFVGGPAKKFTQSMFNYKASERVSMEVIVSIQRLNYGKPVFDEAIVEKLRQQMFHADETMRGYAIDFHVGTLCKPDDTDNGKNLEILQHILRLYVRYEHRTDSLSALIADLWQLEFFDDWHTVFNLLDEESAREDNLFMMYSVVHVINQCFALLMKDLDQDEPECLPRLIGLLKSFLQDYPPALQKCASYGHPYAILLQSADVALHAKIKKFVKLDQYYEELFSVLEEVAHTGRHFYMLSKNLAVIRSYWNVIVDVEQMWADLLQQYADELVATRSKINSLNIGKCRELSDAYADCVTRLTAFLEQDHSISAHLKGLTQIVFNDRHLLVKLQLTSEQTGIFYRMYKCLFHAIVKSVQVDLTDGHPLETLSTLFPRQPGQRLKKHAMELLRVLIKQLQKYDEPLDTSVHMFVALCDMLLVTQDAVANLDDAAELEMIVYTVEPALLQRMAKFVLNYLFKQDDWHEAPLMKQKQMLIKYTQLYELHKSLPRITDTHYVVANFAIDSAFDKQLKDLMKVLHRCDPSQFCEVITQAAFQLQQGYKSEASVKNFFKKFQTFALAKLTADNKEEYYTVMSKLVEKILNNLMHVLADPEPGAEPKRMFKLIEPLLPDVPIEERLAMENLLMRHPEYERLTDADRRAVTRFVKHLNPQARIIEPSAIGFGFCN